jgi:dethiobiotin synthetase
MVPLDEPGQTVLDLAAWLRLPAVVVARPSLGTINHTLLTVFALRGAGVKVAGVVVNRYPPENADVATETNPRAIEKWGKVPLTGIVPDEAVPGVLMPIGIAAAVAAVDWERIVGLSE